MAKKSTYFCDYCKAEYKPSEGGTVSGEFHYVTAGIDRVHDKNYIKIIDRKGNKPDLCNSCLRSEIGRMLGVKIID